MTATPMPENRRLWRPYMVERPWRRHRSDFAIGGVPSDLKAYFIVLDDMQTPPAEQRAAAVKLLEMVRVGKYEGVSDELNRLAGAYAEWNAQRRSVLPGSNALPQGP